MRYSIHPRFFVSDPIKIKNLLYFYGKSVLCTMHSGVSFDGELRIYFPFEVHHIRKVKTV